MGGPSDAHCSERLCEPRDHASVGEGPAVAILQLLQHHTAGLANAEGVFKQIDELLRREAARQRLRCRQVCDWGQKRLAGEGRAQRRDQARDTGSRVARISECG